MTGNTFTGNAETGVVLNDAERPYGTADVDGNRYVGVGFGFDGRDGRSFDDWRAAHPGWDERGTWTADAELDVQVRPNRYEEGRAMVVVRNPGGGPTVTVDPSSFLAPGAAYEVIDAFDWERGAVATGTWDGDPIALPMDGERATPIGGPPTEHVAPFFGTFIVRTT